MGEFQDPLATIGLCMIEKEKEKVKPRDSRDRGFKLPFSVDCRQDAARSKIPMNRAVWQQPKNEFLLKN